MNLTICVVSAQLELFKRTLDFAIGNAREPIHVIGFGNGWTEDETKEAESYAVHCLEDFQGATVLIASVPENGSVAAARHRIWELAVAMRSGPVPMAAEDDILCYLHDDVEILEKGWDVRVKTVFSEHPDVGLAGFACALGLGEDTIYKTPYVLQQVGRHTFGSNMVDAELHGFRTTTNMEAASPDGFSMILRRSLLDKVGGWDYFPYLHHTYDYAIACLARRHGFKCWLIACLVRHWGGKTSLTEIHRKTAEAYGGDDQVHKDGHRWLYDNFRDVLPFRVR
jgi:hypothetical protein